jgi:hypothetical protein
MSKVDPARPITRDDIEAKLRQLQRSAQPGAQEARGVGMAGAIGLGAVVVIGAYLLGRRRGRKRRSVIEIRRI